MNHVHPPVATALLGLDYIVDIMHPDGRIARSAQMAAQRHVIDRFNAVRVIADRRGWPVIHVRVGFAPGYIDQPKQSPLFGRAHEVGALDLSGSGTHFHPDLAVLDHDIIITKSRVSAFYGTNLEPLLRAAGVTRLVIAGVSTSMAVQAAVRDAHDRDYSVLLLEDACAAATLDEHEDSVAMLGALAQVVTVEELSSLP